MSESLGNGPLMIREPYDRVFKAALLVSTAINAALVAAWVVAEILGSSPSSLVMVIAVIAMAVSSYGVIMYGQKRAYSELQIDNVQVTAGVWPRRLAVILIEQVLTSEVVEINPREDYGGWGIKGSEQDRLIGGRGTTALRITYTHTSGEQRRLTFLTDRADEAQRRIVLEQAL
ncbi:MAG: hypothetical protein OXF75_03860 [Acidimicrobiaceae bacterium]|nr:hypothetical protein [Acidimicrobiaceae bacterium]